MRTILLVTSAVLLAGCATPTMTASNAMSDATAKGAQQASGEGMYPPEAPPPPSLRRPPRTIRGWASTGAGGMY